MSEFEIRKDPDIEAIFNEAQLDHIGNSLVSKLIRIYKDVSMIVNIDNFNS